MPSERLTIERTLPDRWHLEIDMGPPSYEHRILDVATLAQAIAEITKAAAKIEPADTAENSSVGSLANTTPAPEVIPQVAQLVPPLPARSAGPTVEHKE